MEGDRSGKIFMTGRSQAVRLPKEFRFDCEEVNIRREGESLVLTPKRKMRRYKSWADYFKHAPRLPDDFEVPKDPPGSEREIEF